MDALTLTAILVLVAGAVTLIIYPMWQQSRNEALFQVDRTGRTLEELEARYQASLAAIKDLMFDYDMGKVEEEDYQVLLAKTKLEAAQFRQQIDRLLELEADEELPIDPALEAEIEAEVNRFRQQTPPELAPLGAAVAAEIEALKEVTPGHFCPHCGRAAQPEDAFCSGCGQPLEFEENTCPSCGQPVKPDDLFCVKCGTRLNPDPEVSDYENARA